MTQEVARTNRQNLTTIVHTTVVEGQRIIENRTLGEEAENAKKACFWVSWTLLYLNLEKQVSFQNLNEYVL